MKQPANYLCKAATSVTGKGNGVPTAVKNAGTGGYPCCFEEASPLTAGILRHQFKQTVRQRLSQTTFFGQHHLLFETPETQEPLLNSVGASEKQFDLIVSDWTLNYSTVFAALPVVCLPAANLAVCCLPCAGPTDKAVIYVP